MPLIDSPQLVEGQPARLDVGASLPCRVIGFSGGNVVLALGAQPPEPLAAGDVGYLLLETRGKLNALRGQVTAPAGDEVVLQLSDDIRLGQRRLFSRAPLTLPATLRGGPGVEWTTVTHDVSAGGVRVARAAADPDAGTGSLELTLRVGEHDVTAEVSLMRATARDLGLRFDRIERDDRLLLASLALAYHRRS